MFSQQRRFYQKKLFYVMLTVCIFSFGLWMNHSMKPEDSTAAMKKETAAQAAAEKEAAQARMETNSRDTRESNDSLRDEDPAQDDSIPELRAEPPYYFIQAQQGFVKVFYFNEDGQGELVRTTAISFSLLSDLDQDLLQDGIVKKSEEEMMELLQDFES